MTLCAAPPFYFFFFLGNCSNKGAGKPGESGPCWRGSAKDKGFAGNKAPTRAPTDRGKPGHVGVPRRRNKGLRGTRRQQGHRQTVKIRAVLAWPDGGKRLCGEQGANKGTGGPGKTGPCWRDPTKDKGFAGNKAPTKAPGKRENSGRVGVARRRTKALQGTRRQQGRRQAEKIRTVLAWPNEGQRLCGEVDANFTKVYNKNIVTEATTG